MSYKDLYFDIAIGIQESINVFSVSICTVLVIVKNHCHYLQNTYISLVVPSPRFRGFETKKRMDALNYLSILQLDHQILYWIRVKHVLGGFTPLFRQGNYLISGMQKIAFSVCTVVTQPI